jgi:hypothetical protein
MAIPVVLSTIFRGLLKAVGKSEKQLFLPSPSGGFITIQRQIWESPFERINNRLAQIHAMFARSAISPDSPLMRIWNVIERLFRTIFMPLELLFSSLLLPLIPILRVGLRFMFTYVMPFAIEVFQRMWDFTENIDNALTFLAGIFGFTGKPKDEDKTKGKDEKPKPFWETIAEFFHNLFKIPTAEATSEGMDSTDVKQQTENKISNPILEFFSKIYDALTNHPIVTQIHNIVFTKMLYPIVNFLDKFESIFYTHPIATQIQYFVTFKMLIPIVQLLDKFESIFYTHPIAIRIYELVVVKMLFPVLEFITKFNNALNSHPVVVGINQLIQQNVINPIVNLIAKIANKFIELDNSIPTKIKEVEVAINNLINNIKSRISALASSVSIGVVGGGGGGGGGGGRTSSSGGFGLGSQTGFGGMRGGSAIPLQHGGLILEPIFGVGMLTGRRYTLAEKQPELVTPLNQLQSMSGITININVNGNIIGINDFENRIKQIVEMELRRVK